MTVRSQYPRTPSALHISTHPSLTVLRSSQVSVHEKQSAKLTMQNLWRNTEAVADSLAAMIKRELTTSHSCSCHEGYLNSSDPNLITADDRMKLVDWCYDIVEHCRYSRETVASAMEMVDRFLGMPSDSVDAARVSDEALIDPSKFQLLTVAALYTSIKINEKVAISSDQFAEMCRHVYTAEEIEDMERTMLRGLSWRCHAPTAHQVGLSILSLLLFRQHFRRNLGIPRG
eukprot:scaffold2845_cov147-Skeletonema_marinoi.AAC.5